MHGEFQSLEKKEKNMKEKLYRAAQLRVIIHKHFLLPATRVFQVLFGGFSLILPETKRNKFF